MKSKEEPELDEHAQIGDIEREHEALQRTQGRSPSSRQGSGISSGQAPKATRGYRSPVAVLLILITYGSLYPLTWNFDKPSEFIFLGQISEIGIIDMVENVVLFLPLGGLLGWHYDGRIRKRLHFWKWFVVALVVASILQWLQKYLPRTPAASDILFNMVGHVAGWWAGRFSAKTLSRTVERHQDLAKSDHFALLMLVIWVVAELFPLIPAFDVSTLIDNFKSIRQQDLWQPGRIWAHVGMTLIGLEALAHLLRSAARGRLVRPLAVMATLGMLAGKFLVLGQSPGLAVPIGIVGGAVLWWCIDLISEEKRLPTVLMISSASYLVYALAPFEFREFPTSMHWMPFASALQGSIDRVVTSVAFEALCFGAIIWSSLRMSALLPGTTLSVAALAFGCEWLQRYLPGRTAEISSVLTALAMGWLVASLSQAGTRHKARSNRRV